MSGQRFCSSLPFTPGDAAAGTENELQTVVAGDQKDVDLPTVIRESSFYRNMAKRAASGDAPKKALASLEQFLDDNTENVWENSWVRFPGGPCRSTPKASSNGTFWRTRGTGPAPKERTRTASASETKMVT